MLDDWFFDTFWFPEPLDGARRRGSVLAATLVGLGVIAVGAAATGAVAVWNDEYTWVVILVVAGCIGWVVRTFERRVTLARRRVHAAALMVLAIVVSDYAYLAFFDGERFAPMLIPVADLVGWELEMLSSPPVLGAVMWCIPVGLAVAGVLAVDEGEKDAAALSSASTVPLPAAQVVSVDGRGAVPRDCAIHVVLAPSERGVVHRTVVCRTSQVEVLTPFLLEGSKRDVRAGAVGRRPKVRDVVLRTAAEAFEDAYSAWPRARTALWLPPDEFAALSSSPAVQDPRPAGRHRAPESGDAEEARRHGRTRHA